MKSVKFAKISLVFRPLAAAAPVLALFLAAAGPAAATVPAIGLVRAVEIAERATGGQVMEVDLARRGGGRLVYEVEVASDNALREIVVDARTGKVVATYRERAEGWFWQLRGGAYGVLEKARPLSVTLRQLERSSGGDVIDVDFDVEGGQARYEVELSTAAGIASMYLDPRTGQRLAFVVDD